MASVVPAAAATPRPQQPSLGFTNILRSEWTKLHSVRSNYWTAFAAFLATIGVAALLCGYWANALRTHPGRLSALDDPITTSLTGIFLAQVAVGTLGVLHISSEFGTGMIRATFTAVPQRRVLLAAKGLVFAGVTLLGAEIVSFLAFGLGQAILSTQHVGSSLTQPGAARATVGAGLYLTAVGLLGFGVGALVRHTAGALSAFFGLLFAPSALVDLLPPSLHHIIEYMPANAGSQIFTAHHQHGALQPWAGLAVFCLYALAAIAVASVLVSRRDA